jgi:hypothetical protein
LFFIFLKKKKNLNRKMFGVLKLNYDSLQLE